MVVTIPPGSPVALGEVRWYRRSRPDDLILKASELWRNPVHERDGRSGRVKGEFQGVEVPVSDVDGEVLCGVHANPAAGGQPVVRGHEVTGPWDGLPLTTGWPTAIRYRVNTTKNLTVKTQAIHTPTLAVHATGTREVQRP